MLRIISLYIDIEGVSPLRFISIGLEREKKHDKEKLIYLSSVILIIIVAIVGMIAFVHFKYGNQTEDNTQKEVKNSENIHIAIVNEDQPTKYNGKRLN